MTSDRHDDYFQRGLPVLSRLAEVHADLEPDIRFVVVGPTQSDLERHAPYLAACVDECRIARLVPIHAESTLTDAVTEHFRAAMDVGGFPFTSDGPGAGLACWSIFAIPPSVRFELTANDVLPSSTRRKVQDADPALALMATTQHFSMGYIAILSSTAIAGPQSAELRRAFADAWREQREPSVAEISRALRSVDWDTSSQQSLAAADRDRAIDDYVANGLARCEIPPIRPELLWRLNDDDVDPIYIAQLTSNTLAVGPVHCRSLSAERTRLFAADKSLVARMKAIQNGYEPRTEDDHFVTVDSFLASKEWSVDTGPCDEELRLIEQLGFPIVRLGDIATIEEDVGETSDGRRRVWLNRFPSYRCEVSMQRPERANGWIAICCDSPEFLARLFHDDAVMAQLRSSAYGSWEEPRLAASQLRDIKVPWPNATQRRSLVESTKAASTRVEALAELGNEATDIANQLEELVAKAPPWQIERSWRVFAHRVASAVKSITCVEQWPAPIAILRRRMAQEQESRNKLWCAMDAFDQLVRLDTAIVMSIIHAVEPERCGAVVEAISTNRGRDSKKELALSHGHWNELQQKSRRELQRITIPDHMRGLEALRLEVLACNSNRVREIHDDYLQVRNKERGHGSNPMPRRAEYLLNIVERNLRIVEAELAYLSRRLMFQPLDRVVESTRCRFRRRILSGDNPEFVVQTIERNRRSELEELLDGDVYLDLDRDSSLALWPWVCVCDDLAQGVTIGVFDGLKKRAGVWDRPLGPRRHDVPSAEKRYEDSRRLEELRKYLGVS